MQLLRACPLSPIEPGLAGPLEALAGGEQQERIANSKLERLAAELRALGITF